MFVCQLRLVSIVVWWCCLYSKNKKTSFVLISSKVQFWTINLSPKFILHVDSILRCIIALLFFFIHLTLQLIVWLCLLSTRHKRGQQWANTRGNDRESGNSKPPIITSAIEDSVRNAPWKTAQMNIVDEKIVFFLHSMMDSLASFKLSDKCSNGKLVYPFVYIQIKQ